jgi:hypothetical protein
MKKMLPYLIGIIVIGAIGFFVYKKFVRGRVPQQTMGAGKDTAASNKLLSAAASASTAKRSGGWRSKIGGFAKSTIGGAIGAGSSALSSPAAGTALASLLNK